MSTSKLSDILSQLQSSSSSPPQKITSLLSSAKRELLNLNALLPTPTTPSPILLLARQTLEAGALLSIRLQQPDAFTRYYQQLLPFYELPDSSYQTRNNDLRGQRSKITGLYLLLLLTKGDYAGFHTVLEGLEAGQPAEGKGLEGDEFISYPVKLERWLMEGSYDRVWGATKREGVPSEEYGVFSEVSRLQACIPNAVQRLLEIQGRRLITRKGTDWYDTGRDCLVFREGISFAPNSQRQEPALPRERRKRCRVREREGLGGQRWEDILPSTRRYADR